jgi:dUTP pyrophosphatase
MPAKGTHEASCWDIRSVQTVAIEPGSVAKVPTGLAFDVPMGWELLVRSRSGLASKGIIVANSPGTVDSDYTGEVFVLLLNTTATPYFVTAGDKIAQITLAPTAQVIFHKGEVDKQTERGSNGFGSTGKN